MSVINITGNSMWDVQKRQALMQKKRLKTALKNGPTQVERVTDGSFDDFNDANDDMLGSVFQLVSQYQNMGGKLRKKMSGSGRKLAGSGRKRNKMKGGANSDDEEDGNWSDESDDEDTKKKKKNVRKEKKGFTGSNEC